MSKIRLRAVMNPKISVAEHGKRRVARANFQHRRCWLVSSLPATWAPSTLWLCPRPLGLPDALPAASRRRKWKEGEGAHLPLNHHIRKVIPIIPVLSHWQESLS